MEYYSAIKKNKMPFAATRTDLKIIILSEVSQRQIYVQTKKKKKRCTQTNLQNRDRFTDLENKLIVTKGEMKGGIS